MKKNIYKYLLVLIALSGSFFSAQAQYHITSGTFTVPLDSACGSPYFQVETDAFTTGLSVVTFFGDGSSASHTIYNGGGTGFTSFNHDYSSPGTYTIKHVLFNGTDPIDSAIFIKEYLYCQTFIMKCYNDLNSNCTYDSASEPFVPLPFTVEVSKAGVPIDTFTTLSGFYYTVTGLVGDVFAFKILSAPAGVTIACPSTHIIYDTIHMMANDHVVKYFGAQCTGSSGLDVGAFASVRAGRHSYMTEIVVNNAYCSPQNATLVMHASPKYGTFIGATPAPTSVVGHTLTWNLTGVSLISPAYVNVHFEEMPWLIPGDTVHTDIDLSPTTGDVDLSNNTVHMIDTVTGSFDPNDKAVKPTGFITAGTKLTYTLRFENTGNDTAFNIHIMDTLSDNLDFKTLDVIASSAVMNLSVLKYGTRKVVKFDFPNINLLDSSHHGLCDGMVMFSIKTNPGLAFGTAIDNRAGIYFDYNDVVMTNNVRNVIGTPSAVAVMSNVGGFELYPNPVDNELAINIDNTQFNELSVTNATGQALLTQNLKAAQIKLNVSSFPAGIYILTIKGPGGVQVKKFEKL